MIKRENFELTPRDRERFWAKVNKDGPVLDPALGSCWIWTGCVSTCGYGDFYLWVGNHLPAPRMSWWLLVGSRPPRDIDVCHHCDNRLCVRPEHLFAGTRADNMQDASRKGRLQRTEEEKAARKPFMRRGDLHAFTQVRDAQIVEMRALRADGAPIASLAARYGVSLGYIRAVTNGRTRVEAGGVVTVKPRIAPDQVLEIRLAWDRGDSLQAIADKHGIKKKLAQVVGLRHVWKEVPEENPRESYVRGPQTILTADNVREIRRRVATGEKYEPIAADFSVSRPTISEIVHRRTWAHVE